MAIKEGEYDAAAAMLLEVLEVNPEHAESERLLDKLHERADAEANRVEVPAGPNEINGGVTMRSRRQSSENGVRARIAPISSGSHVLTT